MATVNTLINCIDLFKEHIKAKQDLIKTLMEKEEFCKSAKKLLSSLPDMARLISRFGNLAYGIRPDTHPEKRAVMYEEILYNRYE